MRGDTSFRGPFPLGHEFVAEVVALGEDVAGFQRGQRVTVSFHCCGTCDWCRAGLTPGPEDLYDVINERYEKASMILTSNRDRSEWPELFGEALLASAALDRLTHGAHFVEITGASFRAEATKKEVANRRMRTTNN